MKFNKFDILSFLPELTVKEFSIITDLKANNPQPGILIRILSLFRHAFNFINFKSLRRDNIIPNNSILLFGQNYNELLPYENLKNNISEESSKNLYLFGNKKYKNDFPYKKIYLLSIFFIPFVFFNYILEKNKFKLQGYKYGFDQLCIICATIFILPSYLNSLYPSKVVISNHNSPFHLILIATCKRLNIKTAYIQHALFHMKKFNFPLDLDEIFLDGFDSYNKLSYLYNFKKQIYIIGSLFQYTKSNSTISFSSKNIIGICINQADNIEAISNLIKNLKSSATKFAIILRPHPSDRRLKFWIIFCNNHNIMISHSIIIDKFLLQIDYLISGESNSHLMALNLNIPSIYYNFSPGYFDDFYGFVLNKLLIDCTKIEALIDFLSQKHTNIRNKLKYYNHSIDTKYEEKIPFIIYKILNNDNSYLEYVDNYETHSQSQIQSLKN